MSEQEFSIRKLTGNGPAASIESMKKGLFNEKNSTRMAEKLGSLSGSEVTYGWLFRSINFLFLSANPTRFWH